MWLCRPVMAQQRRRARLHKAHGSRYSLWKSGGLAASGMMAGRRASFLGVTMELNMGKDQQRVPEDVLAGRVRAGMTFYQKVWAVCCRVPAGKVTTYGAIARALGNPNSGRAVGGAMNKNPYAPTVPCHRVVGSDGSLTGYAGGLEKKVKMLRAEGVEVSDGKVGRGYVVEV